MGNPHVLVIPYPAQGHVIPSMEVSKCLLKHGIKITFLNTEDNHKLVTDALTMKDEMGNQIHLVSVPVNLDPEEYKSYPEKIGKALFRLLPRKVKEIIEQVNATESEKITCVLADQLLGRPMEAFTNLRK